MTLRSTAVAVGIGVLAVLVVGTGVAVGASAVDGPGQPSLEPATADRPLAVDGPIAQADECTEETAETFPNRITTGPIEPEVGEEVFTRVNVTNFGQTAGKETVRFYIDGAVHASRTVSVPACGESSTTFYYTFQEIGNHTIGVNDDPALHDIAVQEAEEPDGITVAPAVLDVGNTTIGDTADATLTLTNQGDRTVSGIRPALPDGEGGTRFSVLTEGPQSLAPGETLEVRVRFRPAETGQVTTLLQFRNASGVEVASARLVGTGVGPDLTVEPGSLSFSDVGVGDRAERTVTVSNTGSAQVTVDALRLLGGDSDFTVETAAGFTLAPDDSRQVTVAFEPASQGAQSASLQVQPADDAVASEVVWLSTSRATATVDLGQSPDRTWVSVDVSDAVAGEEVAVPVPERAGPSNASIQELGVTPAVDANFSITATDSDEPLPSSPTFRLGDGTTPLDYLSVDHTIDNADVASASLTVRVSTDRLAALNTTAENVSLYRYDGTEWVPQPTTVRAETDTYAILAATSDGLSEWTAAAKKPRFNISDASTSLEAGAVGDDVTIQVFVSNTGGASGVYVAKLLLNGEVVDRREATIPDGGKRALNFERSFDDPGIYEVRVNDVYVGTVNISGADQNVDVGTSSDGGTDGAAGDGSDGGTGGDGSAADTGGDDAEGSGPLPPLPALVLIGGAILLVAAYVRYSGKPPGTGPDVPPDQVQGGPERPGGPPHGASGQQGGQQGQQPGGQQGGQAGRGSGGRQSGQAGGQEGQQPGGRQGGGQGSESLHDDSDGGEWDDRR
jgi:hypothetical protein